MSSAHRRPGRMGTAPKASEAPGTPGSSGRWRGAPPAVPPAAGTVPPKDRPVDHRGSGHSAVTAIPAAVSNPVYHVEQNHQNHQQNQYRQQGGHKAEHRVPSRAGRIAEEKMDCAHQVQHGAAVITALYAAVEVGVHKACRRTGQIVIENPLCRKGGLLRAGLNEEDAVVAAQFQLNAPVPGGILNAVPGIPDDDHRQDTARQAVPVGVVEGNGVFLAGGENACLVDHVFPEVGDIHILVERNASLRRGNGRALGQAVKRGQGDGRDEDQGRKGPVFQ